MKRFGKLSMIALLALAACGKEPVVLEAEKFCGMVDAQDYLKAWEMLSDEDKAQADAPGFFAMFFDSAKVGGLDSTIGMKVLETKGDTTLVQQTRLTLNYATLKEIAGKRNTVTEYVATLRKGGNLKLYTVVDSSRVLRMIKSGEKYKVHLGLGGQDELKATFDSLLAPLAKQVAVTAKGAEIRNYIYDRFTLLGSITNNSDYTLSQIVYDVKINGKMVGRVTYEKPLSPKAKYSGEITAYFVEDVSPQNFGTSHDKTMKTFSGGQIKLTMVSAQPQDISMVQTKAEQISGIKPVKL